MLTIDDIRRKCPAAFAATPSLSVSDRYAHVTTSDVLERLFSEGFMASRAQQVGKTDKGFHLVTLRHPDHKPLIDGTVPELILTNSSDGSRAFKLAMGMFRFVCANGIVVGHTFASHLVDHLRNAPELCLEAAEKAGKDLDKLAAWCDRAASLPASLDWQEQYARRAAAIRWKGPLGTVEPVGVEAPEALLLARRTEDLPETVWHVYNRVQENLVRGGTIHTIGATGRRTQAKALSSTSKFVDINSRLFDLTTQMMEAA